MYRLLLLTLLLSSSMANSQTPTPVIVKNTTKTTIPVNIVADQPFQVRLDRSTGDSFTVPSGKRLVIESVSGSFNGDQGARLLSVSLQTTVSGTLADHFFVPTFMAENNGGGLITDYLGFSQETRLYADAGTTVTLIISQTNGKNINGWDVGVSGYLVKVP